MLHHMEEELGTSARTAAAKRVFQNTAAWMLHEDLLYTYHLNGFSPYRADCPKRSVFNLTS